jgi:hypothetical protein
MSFEPFFGSAFSFFSAGYIDFFGAFASIGKDYNFIGTYLEETARNRQIRFLAVFSDEQLSRFEYGHEGSVMR